MFEKQEESLEKNKSNVCSKYPTEAERKACYEGLKKGIILGLDINKLEEL